MPARRTRALRFVKRTRCPACARIITLEHLPYRNGGPHQHPTFDGLELLRCTRCDTAWALRSPSSRKLAAYYSSSYTPARMGHLKKDEWPIWDSRPVSLITLARLFTTFEPDDLFVDVGPGNGAALSVAPLLLPSPRIGCVEFNRRSIAFFQRHNPEIVVRESVGDFVKDFGAESVAMVYSAHSFEHFRPADLLSEARKIHRALKVGGALAVEVPYAPATKTANAARHTPHLWFFSIEGLRHLLQRAGFSVELCIKVVGRTKVGLKHMADNYRTPDPAIGRGLALRVQTVNVGDLIASPAPAADSPGVVIKCIAVKVAQSSNPRDGHAANRPSRWMQPRPFETAPRLEPS